MRRLTVECRDGHQEEIVIGTLDKIPRCSRFRKAMNPLHEGSFCHKKREIIWGDGSAGFRVKGATKRF